MVKEAWILHGTGPDVITIVFQYRLSFAFPTSPFAALGTSVSFFPFYLSPFSRFTILASMDVLSFVSVNLGDLFITLPSGLYGCSPVIDSP